MISNNYRNSCFGKAEKLEMYYKVRNGTIYCRENQEITKVTSFTAYAQSVPHSHECTI